MSLEVKKEIKSRVEKEFSHCFGNNENLRFFSAPGRTELGGNHTDHNHGKVLAAAIQLEAFAAARINTTQETEVKIYSKGWDVSFRVDLKNLSVVPEEAGKTESLIRGVAAEFARRGYKLGGFQAYMESSVLPGSGLSSSASVEVLLGVILSQLFNQGQIDCAELAMIGQIAENKFFGKPCGLMDQMASALGGVISIDFADTQKPVVKKFNLDLASYGYSLIIVDTGGSHADLTGDYAAIRSEMQSIAKLFDKNVLREVPEEEFYKKLPQIHSKISDRALLRAIHFYGDNNRVDQMTGALEKGDLQTYLNLVNESGRSSFQFLQNAYPLARPDEQGVGLALALTQKFLGSQGACRVHGGGFAGTIQAYIPTSRRKEYIQSMEMVFGTGRVIELSIRPETAGEEK